MVILAWNVICNIFHRFKSILYYKTNKSQWGRCNGCVNPRYNPIHKTYNVEYELLKLRNAGMQPIHIQQQQQQKHFQFGSLPLFVSLFWLCVLYFICILRSIWFFLVIHHFFLSAASSFLLFIIYFRITHLTQVIFGSWFILSSIFLFRSMIFLDRFVRIV